MSQGGSLGGPSAAFPGSEAPDITPPPASAENPGRVYPKVDPSASAPPAEPYHPPDLQAAKPQDEASPAPPAAVPTATNAPVPGGAQASGGGEDPRAVLGNPFEMDSLLGNLTGALTSLISSLNDGGSQASPEGNAMRARFEGWRDEVDGMRKGQGVQVQERDVQQREGQGKEEGGLYAD